MYKRILVPLDGSQIAECVIPHIKAIARNSSTEVELISVVEPIDIPTRGKIAFSEDDLKSIDAEAKQEAHKYLTHIVKRLSRADVNARPVVITGKPAESLIDYAGNNDIDLIIMATHGRSGLTRWFFGSIAEKLMRAVEIPILLVKADGCEMEAK